MKKNKVIIIIAIVIAFIFLLIGFLLRNPQESDNDEWEIVYNIKSSKENPIQKEDVEVENIDIVQRNGQVKTVYTLKNNSNKKIKEFFIAFELLDENNNVVTTVAGSINKPIRAKGKATYESYTSFPYEKIKITSARIEGEESNNQESIEKAPKE